MNGGKSVVVCGAGVTGLACAYHLARAGMQVTVLERSPEGADSCAHGSAGFVSPSHLAPLAAPGMIGRALGFLLDARSPFYLKPRIDPELLRWGLLFARHCSTGHLRRAAPLLRDLCLRSRALYAEFAAGAGAAIEWREDGILNICATQAALDHEAEGHARLAREFGVAVEVLDSRALAALEPGCAMRAAGAVYFPGDAHLSPRRLMPALLAAARAAGALVRYDSGVSGFRTDGDRIVAARVGAGEVAADEFVLASGSWAGQSAATLGLRLPMQAGKGYSLTLPDPPLLPRRPLLLVEHSVAVTPMGAALRFGGTMEIAGHDGRVHAARVEAIVAAACARFPALAAGDFAGIEPWYGYRPVSPDGLPYIGRFARFPNLIAACGHAMIGVTLAPVTGELVTDLVRGVAPPIDIALLRPGRFG